MGIFSISAIILLAAISPGPDFAIVSRNALRYNQRAAIMTSLGIAVSTLVHATYCILGLALVNSHSLLMFNIIKYIGAAYLVFLGFKGLMEKSSGASVEDGPSNSSLSLFKAFQHGLLCNLLNPKCIFFFLALFTVMIRTDMPLMMQAGYAIEIALVHFVWFSLVSYFFSHSKIKQALGNAMSISSKDLQGC